MEAAVLTANGLAPPGRPQEVHTYLSVVSDQLLFGAVEVGVFTSLGFASLVVEHSL